MGANLNSVHLIGRCTKLDLEIFGSADKSHKADLAVQGLRKGSLAFVEGHLKLDQWTGQDGAKHSRLKIVVDDFQFLDPKQQTTPAQQQDYEPPGGPGDIPGGMPQEDAGSIPFTWLVPWLIAWTAALSVIS